MFEDIETQLRARKWDEAAESCRELLAVHPESAKAHGYLGLCYYRNGDYRQAATSLRKATYLDPNHVDAGIKLAQSLYRLRRFKEGLNIAREFLRLKPNDNLLRGLVEAMASIDEASEHDAWERTAGIYDYVHIPVVEE